MRVISCANKNNFWSFGNQRANRILYFHVFLTNVYPLSRNLRFFEFIFYSVKNFYRFNREMIEEKKFQVTVWNHLENEKYIN